jgi:hypothetical protein
MMILDLYQNFFQIYLKSLTLENGTALIHFVLERAALDIILDRTGNKYKREEDQ